VNASDLPITQHKICDYALCRTAWLQYSVGYAQGPGAGPITEIQIDQMAANGPVKVVVVVVWE